ncbi:glycosyltransferase [Amycolatopsis viridis]|uniref:Glycosyltransferase involved in cell wall biosynthesis n=1 Tax=Amycolatopsis viridis TaxID=185678 RepID=A0ABX0SZX2_9PSEU|nr:glycosyltransferase [Amycolatopsis viridis]NIH80856.1 glycosyltransferase involved in cell wall biosynthesis [Amycolatopsis viridis]
MSGPRVATVITRLQAGAGIVALRGAEALAARGYQVTIIAGSGDRLLDQAGVEVVREPALRAPIAPRDDLVALHRLTGLFTRRPFDVVHTHSAKAGAIGRIAAHRAGVPRIVHTYHGFPFHEFQPLLRRQAYVRIERRLGRITDIALCVGTGVSVEAIRRGLLPPERIRTIAVPVGAEVLPPSPQARPRARRALRLPDSALVVGAVGRLSYQKAPEHFIAAMTALHRPDVVGVWVGDGELAARVQALARAAHPDTRIVLAGERADVPALLPAFDVFALPSRYEGLPVAIVEAMAAGVPVVATAVNAVPDVVRPGETGLLVPPQRPDLLATAIAYLLDRPGEAARLAHAARAQVGARYGAGALADALEAAYQLTPTTADHEESPCA